jgi:AcrR family transcriptional regulator
MAAPAEVEIPARPSKKDLKAEAMKRRICAAVVSCIDELGYAETSINRIQARADVSRGALTHHFPTKQALVAETAMRLLQVALGPVKLRRQGNSGAGAKPTDKLLMESWTKVANTPEGRAFVEIIVACRTDRQLYDVLADDLHDWNDQSSASLMELYRGSDEAEDDAALLWSICRTFIRGLVIHERFVSDPDYLARMMDRFAGIMSAHLFVRE